MPKDINDIWENDEDDTQEFGNEIVKSSEILKKEKENIADEELDKAYLRSLRFRKD